jgi:hypothetical protein
MKNMEDEKPKKTTLAKLIGLPTANDMPPIQDGMMLAPELQDDDPLVLVAIERINSKLTPRPTEDVALAIAKHAVRYFIEDYLVPAQLDYTSKHLQPLLDAVDAAIENHRLTL